MAGDNEVKVLDFLSGRKRFGLAEVTAGTGLTRRQVLRVLDRLCRGGYLREVADRRMENGRKSFGPARRNPTWETVQDPSKRRYQKATRETCRDKVWRSIRVMRRATTSDLIRVTGCKESAVILFLKLLERDGYVRRQARTKPILWLLIKDAGPKRPATPEVRDD
jgi:DNA-binding IclR family transcriptional regulator